MYSKPTGKLWKYYRDESALDDNNNIIGFSTNNNNSISFKFKRQITGRTGNGGVKEIAVSLKYVSSFWKTL